MKISERAAPSQEHSESQKTGATTGEGKDLYSLVQLSILTS